MAGSACCARPATASPPGSQFFKPLRQIIESVNDTFKGQHSAADTVVLLVRGMTGADERVSG